MKKTFKVKFRVRWVDTDAAGVMHFSNYFRYFEDTEIEFYRTLGSDFKEMGSKYGLWFPRVEAQCKYLSPCRFGDEVEVEMTIIELGEKHIKYGFKMENYTTGKTAAEGYIVVVAASKKENRAVRIPEEMRQKIEQFLE